VKKLSERVHAIINCPSCDYEHDYIRKSENLLVAALSNKYSKKVIYDRMFRRTPKGSHVNIAVQELSHPCPKCGAIVWYMEMDRKQLERLEDAFPDAQIFDHKNLFTETQLKERTEGIEIRKRKPKTIYLDTNISDIPVYSALLNEINDCFDNESFSATILLVRKLIENLIVDILRVMYGMSQIDMFYLKDQRRFKNLSDLISVLREKIKDFGGYGLEDRHLRTIEKLREEGNSTSHSIIDHATLGELLELKADARKAILALHKTYTNIANVPK
jgi:predicted RNA-binding Zn-ribbon protein involved in translation (DUF1610 family)/uncharacterized protein YutD